jgi:integrase
MSTLPRAFYDRQQKARAQTLVLRRLKPEQIKVDTWLGGYRGLMPDERTDRTKNQQYHQLLPFRRAYAERLLRSITAIEAQAWALKHPDHVGYLRSAWDAAVRLEVAPINVWKLVVLPRRTGARVRPPTDEELMRIVFEARERNWMGLANMIGVAAYTGAREGGLLSLYRNNVDLQARRMTVTEKGNKTRTIALAGAGLEAMLEQHELRERHGWQQKGGKLGRGGQGGARLVFVNSEAPADAHRHRPLGDRTLQERWATIRGDFPHGFHSLKHYAATWLAAQGISDLDVAVQLGHVDSEGRPYPELVQRVYNHHDNGAALERIARQLG